MKFINKLIGFIGFIVLIPEMILALLLGILRLVPPSIAYVWGESIARRLEIVGEYIDGKENRKGK